MSSKRGKAQKQDDGKGEKYPDELLGRKTKEIIMDTDTYTDR
jgi:hypothetical protein